MCNLVEVDRNSHFMRIDDFGLLTTTITHELQPYLALGHQRPKYPGRRVFEVVRNDFSTESGLAATARSLQHAMRVLLANLLFVVYVGFRRCVANVPET